MAIFAEENEDMLLLLLSALLLPLPSLAKKKNPYFDCKRKFAAYDKALAEPGNKKQSCTKDSDCDLIFIGYGLDGCDLGAPVSKKVMGKAYFKKLERLGEATRDACPPWSPDQIQCMAIPLSKALCVEGRCEGE